MAERFRYYRELSPSVAKVWRESDAAAQAMNVRAGFKLAAAEFKTALDQDADARPQL